MNGLLTCAMAVALSLTPSITLAAGAPDTNGDVCLFTLADTDALIDINGYIGP